MATTPDLISPLRRYLVTIQIPNTSSPRVVEITAANQQEVAATLARAELKYLTQPIDLGPAPLSDAALAQITAQLRTASAAAHEQTTELQKLRTKGLLGSPVVTIAVGVLIGGILTALAALALGAALPSIARIANPGVNSR